MALSFQSSILRSLLHGRQEPPPKPMFVPTPVTAVTSSSSPRACCGTWWQYGQHLDHHLFTHDHLKGNNVINDDDVSSSDGSNPLPSSTNSSEALLTPAVDFNQYQNHLISDENGISSTTY